jgi:two-component system OmpR family response regulator
MKILVIEDDLGIARLVRAILVGDGYAVDLASSGEEGQALALANQYDGIVLDLGLGDRHGLTVLQELRREGLLTPVLILTADSAESSIVRALDAGADEYAVKPVRNRELAARVRALVRRRDKPSEPEHLAVETLALNRLSRKASVRGTALNLSPREFALLEHLMQHVNMVATRAELLKHVWAMEFDPGSNVVDVHVTRLRRKLEAANAPVRIETRRGAGFTLLPEPTAEA